MKKLLVLFFLLSTSLNSQILTVFGLDTTGFPIIKSKFYAFDKEGNQIPGLSVSDFVVTENGIQRKILSVDCPEPKPAKPVFCCNEHRCLRLDGL